MDEEPGADGAAPQNNDEWFEQNFLDLVERYPRQWIAVVDRQVVARAATKGGAKAEGKRLAGGKEVSLYFVEPTPLPL